MERTLTITRLVALLVMLGASLTAFAQPQVSVWTTIDPHDGSRAYIGVNAEWQIVFYDTDATFGCRSGGGGPFFGFDDNNGNTVSLIGDVLVGYIEGICQNGGPGQNLAFEFGMRYFPDSDTVRSRNTNWDRTFIDQEEFVANAFELKRLSPLTARSGIWDFMGSYAGDDPQIVPGTDCNEDFFYFNGSFTEVTIGENLHQRACDMAFNAIVGGGSNAVLRESNLSGAYIWANLQYSDLSGINLQGANFNFPVIWTGINLRYANLSFATFGSLLGPEQIQMNEIDFKGADLRGVQLKWPTLFNWPNFSHANLEGADLGLSRLQGVIRFRHANLKGVQFSQESLSDVLAYDFLNTICPDGTNSDDNGGICDLTPQ